MNKYTLVIFLSGILLLLTSCDPPSEEAKIAGFSTQKEYLEHQSNLRHERDEELINIILVASSPFNFSDDEFNEAYNNLQKTLTRYKAQGGENHKLIVAGEHLIRELSILMTTMVKSYSDKTENLESYAECMQDISYEYGDAYVQAGKAICELNLVISRSEKSLETNVARANVLTFSVVKDFISEDHQFNSKEEAESMFDYRLNSPNYEETKVEESKEKIEEKQLPQHSEKKDNREVDLESIRAAAKLKTAKKIQENKNKLAIESQQIKTIKQEARESKRKEIATVVEEQAATTDKVSEVDIQEFAENFLPIFVSPPVYPSRALSRGIEGECIVEYTVTRNGTTKDGKVVECSNNLFEKASLKALTKFKYNPLVVNGIPFDVPGVQYKIVYKFSD